MPITLDPDFRKIQSDLHGSNAQKAQVATARPKTPLGQKIGPEDGDGEDSRRGAEAQSWEMERVACVVSTSPIALVN